MAKRGGRPPFVQLDARILTEFGQRIGPNGLAVYLALAKFADNTTRSCYPSVPTIARLIGVSRPTATKALRRLEEAGLIAIKPRRTANGDPTSHEYTLLRPPENGKEALPTQVNDVDLDASPSIAPVLHPVKHPTADSWGGEVNEVEDRTEGPFHELNSINNRQINQEGCGAAAPRSRPPPPPGTPPDTLGQDDGETAAPRSRKARRHDPNLYHPAVRAYRAMCKLTPNELQRAEIAATVDDIAAWEEVMLRWLLRGYRKTNIAGMLDWYTNGVPEQGG